MSTTLQNIQHTTTISEDSLESEINDLIDKLDKPKGTLKLMNDALFGCDLEDVDFDGCDMEVEPKEKEKPTIT